MEKGWEKVTEKEIPSPDTFALSSNNFCNFPKPTKEKERKERESRGKIWGGRWKKRVDEF